MSLPPRPVTVAPVPLSALAAVAGARTPSVDVMVTGVCLRADAVRPGDLYAALPGTTTHGARFCGQARAAGAVAVLTDEHGQQAAVAAGLPALVVAAPRAVLGQVSATAYGQPATALTLIGVTGTSGKTTTTQLISHVLAAAARRTAVIGTLGSAVGPDRFDTHLTTPEAPDLQAMFAVMRERGVEVCAMEVSSHSLALGRVDGVVFDLAVFTNFGRDHLDFHGSLDQYFAAKASLFTPARARRALLNADDPAVAALRTRLDIPAHTYSAAGGPADWWCTDVAGGAHGSRFRLHGPGSCVLDVSTSLVGGFNVSNALVAVAAAGETGFDIRAAAQGLASLGQVPGRLERVDAGQPFAVLVDYAHKPDAVAAVLTALRAITAGRLWIVLGAGGDRDAGKRELMGRAAAELADVLVVTDDNPRTEDPAAIRAALLRGAAQAQPKPGRARATVVEVGDRRRAIEAALVGAAAGDTVLVAGKGHETGQQLASTVVPFDDRVVAREILQGRSAAGRRS